MEEEAAQKGPASPELIKEAQKPERTAPIILPIHGPVVEPCSPPVEEDGGIPIPTSGLLQVTERRQPLSSVSSLEVHFDLLDLTELTDMSDQELAEVFADSDEETVNNEAPDGVRKLWPVDQIRPLMPIHPPHADLIAPRNRNRGVGGRGGMDGGGCGRQRQSCMPVTDGVEMQIGLPGRGEKCIQPPLHPNPRAGYLRSPSWTRTRGETGREKKHLSDSELQSSQGEAFLTLEKPEKE